MNKKLITGIISLAMCLNIGVVTMVFAEETATTSNITAISTEATKISIDNKGNKVLLNEKLKEAKEVKENVKEKLIEKVEKVKELKEKIEIRKENYKKLHSLLEKKIKLINARLELLASDTSVDAIAKVEALKAQLAKTELQITRLDKSIVTEKNLLKEKVKEEYTTEELAKIQEVAQILKEHKDLKLLPVQNVFAKGKNLKFDLPPVIKEGRTLIPIRALSEAYGFDVKWDAETKKITITKGDKVIELFVDSKEAFVNGEKVELDVPAKLYKVNKEGSRTVVPLRFIIEQMGLNVKWDQETETIDIDDEKEVEVKDEDIIEQDATKLDEELNKIENEVDGTIATDETTTNVLEGEITEEAATTEETTTTEAATTTEETSADKDVIVE
ncbi:MAG: hypothetical protein A2Y22_06850 [Clostridiales bacterium GWD2_32_59]|nr:MAG: hypothetical protein A2Y22_06850 [Clostridiales bacterium GWD2_32_59]